MGSPALALKLNPRLRPWFGAGVTHLMAGREYISSLSSSDASLQRPPRPEPQPSTGISKAEAPTRTPVQFPAPWDFFWTKTTAGAQVVFTYELLGLDLSGKGNPKRGQVFREILQHLGWAGKGIVSFWPMTASADDGFEQSKPLFWQGINVLGAKHIVCFGMEAFCALTNQQASKAQAVKVGDITVYPILSPDELMSKLPHERHLAADFLKSIRLKT